MHRTEWLRTLARYLSLSVFMYAFVLCAMYLLVDRLGVEEVTSYVAVYATAYVIQYVTSLRFVFRARHSRAKVLKFVLNTAFFLVLGAGLFRGALLLGVNYLVATVAVAVLLMPLRFLASKLFVYRDAR